MAVPVVISPSCTGAKSAGSHAGLLGYILELAIAEITVQHVSTEPRHVDIKQPVIVEVGHGYAHAPAVPGQACRLGDVFESSIRLLMVQGDHWVAAVAVAIHGGTVDGHDIQFAIVVAIEEADATAHGFEHVTFVRRG